MAEYKHYGFLSQSNDTKYDQEYSPGDTATYPGIYRCKGCQDEIAIAKGNTLPSQNTQQHPTTNGKSSGS